MPRKIITHSAVALFLCILTLLAFHPFFTLSRRQLFSVPIFVRIRYHKLIMASERIRLSSSETAIIVVDMWDQTWCKGETTGRIDELAPAINAFITEARKKGILVIHAAGDVADYYIGYHARQNVKKVPAAMNMPVGFDKERKEKLQFEPGEYRLIDKIDCDCRDCRPDDRVWEKQHPSIQIADPDLISSSGKEIWDIMERWGIKNVILVGVHLNGCLLSRPFGIRNLKSAGKNVIVCRDLTDVIYDPAKSPHFTHAKALDLVIAYVERYLCPTMLSTDLTGDPPFRFSVDKNGNAAHQ